MQCVRFAGYTALRLCLKKCETFYAYFITIGTDDTNNHRSLRQCYQPISSRFFVSRHVSKSNAMCHNGRLYFFEIAIREKSETFYEYFITINTDDTNSHRSLRQCYQPISSRFSVSQHVSESNAMCHNGGLHCLEIAIREKGESFCEYFIAINTDDTNS